MHGPQRQPGGQRQQVAGQRQRAAAGKPAFYKVFHGAATSISTGAKPASVTRYSSVSPLQGRRQAVGEEFPVALDKNIVERLQVQHRAAVAAHDGVQFLGREAVVVVIFGAFLLGPELGQAQFPAAADHLGHDAGIIDEAGVEIKHGREPALAVVALADEEDAVVLVEVAADELRLGADAAAVGKFTVGKAQHAELRQHHLVDAQQHGRRQQQHRPLPGQAPAGRAQFGTEDGRGAVFFFLDAQAPAHLRQQRHRQAGQRHKEPADVVAVDVAVVVLQVFGLEGLEDKPVAEGQHQVIPPQSTAWTAPPARRCAP